MPINSQLLGNVNPQRTEQPRKGRMDSDSVGLAGVASGRDGGISNWTQSFGEDRNSRSLDSFTARATFQNILRCGLVLQFLLIMSPKISPACIHYTFIWFWWRQHEYLFKFWRHDMIMHYNAVGFHRTEKISRFGISETWHVCGWFDWITSKFPQRRIGPFARWFTIW